ncbi:MULTISPECIES: hypothetical protein [unclassified Massilia]|uniref:hypothetical protein n=1 Tax=unclassified Massilia TaxID=2609279 RepID=UPI001603B2CD|nr:MULTISPECIES: hypothetical protein [unclassified Massilia]QNA99355.1 DUF1566 domain-containing protein [Massilia sp. Se16.2.3]
MITHIRSLVPAAAAALTLLAGCGGEGGVPLGEFPAINMAEGETVELKAPSSKSPATFSFSSSNPAVAEVSGTTLFARAPGVSTITAQQGKMGSYNPTSTSTTVTVAAYVSHGGMLWMPPSTTLRNWADAKAFCENTTIKTLDGWRVPTQAELTAMASSVALPSQGWLLADTWTSNPGSGANTHVVLNLSSKVSSSIASDKTAAVTCVRTAP